MNRILVVFASCFIGVSAFAFEYGDSASAAQDIRGCGDIAVEAALKVAKAEYDTGRPLELTFDMFTKIFVAKRSDVTVYGLALSRWHNEDSFSLDYEVVTRGEGPTCKVVRITLTGEE